MKSKDLAQLVSVECVREYKEANIKYRKACSDYTKVRLLSDHPNASIEDIVRHHRAKEEYKEACKEFNIAREKFLREVQSTRGVNAIPDSEYLSLAEGTKLGDINKINSMQTVTSVYADAIAELKEIEAMSEPMKDEVHRLMDAGFKGRTAIDMARENFKKPRENGKREYPKGVDPTENDFEPI